MNQEVLVKLFDDPDEVKHFEKGCFELVYMPNMTIGRATYEPGWKWSDHVGVGVRKFCTVEHLGIVLAGRMAILMEDGTGYELGPGSCFYIPSTAHDGWVVGEEDYVSLHLLGADEYNRQIHHTP